MRDLKWSKLHYFCMYIWLCLFMCLQLFNSVLAVLLIVICSAFICSAFWSATETLTEFEELWDFYIVQGHFLPRQHLGKVDTFADQFNSEDQINVLVCNFGFWGLLLPHENILIIVQFLVYWSTRHFIPYMYNWQWRVRLGKLYPYHL